VNTDLAVRNDFPMPPIIDAAGRAICDGLERKPAEIVSRLRMAWLGKAARLVPVSLWSGLWNRLPDGPAPASINRDEKKEGQP
jgi:hypothetical protein